MLRKAALPLTYLSLLAASLPISAQVMEDEALDELDVVEITGSRIARIAAETPNPVMTLDSENIELSGRTNLTDLLTQAPALVASVTSYDSAGSQAAGFGDAGINLLDLRNLGTKRTLVLVNSRRHIAGQPGVAAVDVNTIPIDLIDRIDVLTGGVSAIYGADGVSGVVNFVMKRDFEGLSLRGQAGESALGDADNRFFSATAGRNFFDDRANVALAYEYNSDKRVRSFDRPRSGDPLQTYSLVRDPNDFPDDPAIPDRILLNDLRYADSSRDSAIDTDWDFTPNYTGTGAEYDLGLSLPGSGGLVQGGSSTPIAGYQGDLQPEQKRHSVNLLASFDVNDRMRLFAEGKFVQIDTFTEAQPSFDFFSFINSDNPFMPDIIRDAIVPGAAGDTFEDPSVPDGALLSRDNFDLGTRGEFVKRETIRSVVGMDGDLSDNARYEVSYTYGQTEARFRSLNYRLEDRYFAALDAVDEGTFLTGIANGNLRCRIDLQAPGSDINPENELIGNYGGGPAVSFTPGAGSGCAPLNLFGEYVASQASLDFINADTLNRSKLSQHVVSGSISGNLGSMMEMPGGSIGYAFGGEYREEKSSSTPDALIQQGFLADLAQIMPENGSFNVKEAFAEINVPVLRDAPFAQSLSFGGAARFSDYSTVGNTLTWKVDARYAPIRDIMFRGTYSEAVRAPNINELFAPTNGGFLFIDDPCDPTNINEGSSFRVANCTALLTDLGVDIGSFSPNDDPEASASIEGLSGGNPLLDEEKAKTWTAGFLLRPSFLPNLTMTADWYNIKLENAINEATAQQVADLCVDEPDLENAYCDSITRDPATGFVTGWLSAPQNVASFNTAGADGTIAYSFDPIPDVGRFRVSISGGYLHKLTLISIPGADVDDDRLESYAPKYQASGDVTWSLEGFTMNYGVNWFSKTRRYTTEQLAGNPDLSDPRFFYYKGKLEHDLRFAYSPADTPVSFYAGVNNLFNELPSVGQQSYPVSFMGRYMYAGLSLRFDQL